MDRQRRKNETLKVDNLRESKLTREFSIKEYCFCFEDFITVMIIVISIATACLKKWSRRGKNRQPGICLSVVKEPKKAL